MTYLVIPMNSSFIGDGGMHCTTRWPMVSAALQRPNMSAVGVLRMRYSRESDSPLASYVMTLANKKVRRPRSSRDGRGPRKAPS